MLEIKGKYNTAKIFTDIVDQESIAQIMLLCNQEITSGSKIRIMPDIHAGAGCTVGTTMTITNKVIPNLVGVDIGCGMELIKIKEKHIELQKLDKLIYQKIPSGFSIREKAHPFIKHISLNNLYCYKEINILRAEKSLGTLGGGNHFIEADKDEEGNIYNADSSQSRESCSNHDNVHGTVKKHSKNSDGSCVVDFYDGKRCSRCGKVVYGNLLNTQGYEKCFH